MLHAFIFGVEPLPEHPNFYEMQSGWAMVCLFACDDSESIAREYLKRKKFKILELQTAREVSPDKYSLMPSGAIDSLQRFPIYSEICGYETGGGPEEPGRLFPPDADRG